jgi:hypothetical protein
MELINVMSLTDEERFKLGFELVKVKKMSEAEKRKFAEKERKSELFNEEMEKKEIKSFYKKNVLS